MNQTKLIDSGSAWELHEIQRREHGFLIYLRLARVEGRFAISDMSDTSFN